MNEWIYTFAEKKVRRQSKECPNKQFLAQKRRWERKFQRRMIGRDDQNLHGKRN